MEVASQTAARVAKAQTVAPWSMAPVDGITPARRAATKPPAPSAISWLTNCQIAVVVSAPFIGDASVGSTRLKPSATPATPSRTNAPSAIVVPARIAPQRARPRPS